MIVSVEVDGQEPVRLGIYYSQSDDELSLEEKVAEAVNSSHCGPSRNGFSCQHRRKSRGRWQFKFTEEEVKARHPFSLPFSDWVSLRITYGDRHANPNYKQSLPIRSDFVDGQLVLEEQYVVVPGFDPAQPGYAWVNFNLSIGWLKPKAESTSTGKRSCRLNPSNLSWIMK